MRFPRTDGMRKMKNRPRGTNKSKSSDLPIFHDVLLRCIASTFVLLLIFIKRGSKMRENVYYLLRLFGYCGVPKYTIPCGVPNSRVITISRD